ISGVKKKAWHHSQLLEGYFQSYRVRNYSPKTLQKEKCFLKTWFKEYGNGDCVLLTWEAMTPVIGRKRITDYANTLLASEVTVDTVRSYLGILRRYFSYVLQFPFVFLQEGGSKRLQDLYGPIDQPVTEYDIPRYAYQGERLGTPLDPERIYEFYSVLLKHYLKQDTGIRQSIRARNYAMVVLAAESGLRIDELTHLEIKKDLFFESKKLQTRYAKGTRGSGKRSRITLFTPLARDTLRYYLKEHRTNLYSLGDSDYLFCSSSGKPLTYALVNKALHEMISVVQKEVFPICSHLQWHWFRRIFATRFIERFPNQVSILIELLGHTSANTVHRYIRHSAAWMDTQMQSVLEKGGDHPIWLSTGD
ncbi:MAG: site-specific integrase, partial [Deltaproteobacteria bacterium]|nr:site-specific integrase [Deltaproteobacteria bacterium]